MKKRHAAFLSLLAAGAIVLGGLAATQTMSARASDSGTAPDPSLTARKRWLDGLERSTKAALARKPPALPPLPHFAPVRVPVVPASPSRVLAVAAPASGGGTHTASPPPKPASPSPHTPVPAAAAAPQPPATTVPVSGDDEESHEHEGEQAGHEHEDGNQSGYGQSGSDAGDD